MLHALALWLLAAALLGAGLSNAIGSPATKASFVRWGYPGWWCRITGALELTSAALLAYPATRDQGLLLGAAIVAAALVTVSRHQEFSHLAPLGFFAGLLGLVIA